MIRDMNQDQCTDVLVFSVLGTDKAAAQDRCLSLFISPRPTEETSGTPNQTVRLRDAIAVDFADLNEDGFSDLILLCREAVYSLESENNRIKEVWNPLLHTRSVFPGADRNRILWYPLTAEFSGGGTPELIIPGHDSIRIYEKTDSLYLPIRDCIIRPDYRFMGNADMDLAVSPPRLTFLDFDDDSRLDLVHLIHDRIRIFLNPSVMRHQRSSLLPDIEYNLGSQRLTHSAVDQVAPVAHQIQLMDLNQDGYADLILSQAARSSYINTISQLHIYFNARGTLASFPDQILTSENVGGEFMMHDLNRDGLQDIILFNLDIGYTSALRFILTRKIVHQYAVYLMRQDNTYPSGPDHKLNVRIDPRGRPLISAMYATSFMDDFNGDDRPDLIVATDKDHWMLYPGKAEGQFRKPNRIRIPSAALTERTSADLNGDGAADLILWNKNDATGGLMILMSAQERLP